MVGDAAGWGELTAALTAFVLTHSIPARPALRSRLVSLVGWRAYLIVYSVVSLLVLAWLIAAAASAPYLELWPREDWQSLVPAIGMVAACALVVFALTTPNPLSLGFGRGKRFDPAHPGVAGFVRHPILFAMLVWSLTHAVPNGDLAHVVMFGLFAVLSAGGMAMLDRRLKRKLGEAVWRELAKRTSNLPLASLGKGWRPALSVPSAVRVVGGIALYLALVAGHGLIAGVPLV